jgi:hypothetical protein
LFLPWHQWTLFVLLSRIDRPATIAKIDLIDAFPASPPALARFLSRSLADRADFMALDDAPTC